MRILIILTMLSCTSQQATKSTGTDKKTTSIESTSSKPPRPGSSTQTVPPKPMETPLPKGKIGGAPILSNPVVIGGISRENVEKGINKQRDVIDRCYQESRKKNPSLAGKVLVKVVIAADGSVSEVLTKATSLRHNPTEECINKTISNASFTELLSGRYAIVQYPFVFGQ